VVPPVPPWDTPEFAPQAIRPAVASNENSEKQRVVIMVVLVFLEGQWQHYMGLVFRE
jgi:hypothetical protein